MSSAKKTVVILTPGFPQNEEDTTCMPFLQDYTLAIVRLYPNVSLRIVSFQYPFKKGHYLWNGIPVYCAGGKTRKGLFRILTWLHVWSELAWIKKSEGIDVIHSLWLTECSLIAQRFARRNNIRHVAYAIGQDVLKTNKYLPWLKFLHINVIAMSESISERFKALTRCEVQGIIPGGVDLGKIDITMQEKTIDIIGVGALTALKNYALFLEVIAGLKKDFPKVKICLIGRGEQEQLLKTKAGELGISDNVQFVGEVTHKQVFEYLNRSKIFLHTSGYEGQSTVMMEALAVGLTIVCFDVGRLHVEGKVVVCKDKDDLIIQLKRLLSSKLDFKPAIIRTADDMVKDFMRAYAL